VFDTLIKIIYLLSHRIVLLTYV